MEVFASAQFARDLCGLVQVEVEFRVENEQVVDLIVHVPIGRIEAVQIVNGDAAIFGEIKRAHQLRNVQVKAVECVATSLRIQT